MYVYGLPLGCVGCSNMLDGFQTCWTDTWSRSGWEWRLGASLERTLDFFHDEGCLCNWSIIIRAFRAEGGTVEAFLKALSFVFLRWWLGERGFFCQMRQREFVKYCELPITCETYWDFNPAPLYSILFYRVRITVDCWLLILKWFVIHVRVLLKLGHYKTCFLYKSSVSPSGCINWFTEGFCICFEKCTRFELHVAIIYIYFRAVRQLFATSRIKVFI